MKNNGPKNFYFSGFWRYITNVWTVLFIGVLVSDYFSHGQYQYLMSSFSIIYGAVLSIFVGTKEFNRWYDLHTGRKHPGEVFVVLWSILLFAMVVYSWISGSGYSIPTEVISVYIMVLTVFAISQSSKTMYKNRKK